jgi:cytochrome P450
MEVLQDTSRFSSRGKKGTEDEPDLPPFDADPPLHGEYRRLLQPYFSRQAAAAGEPIARAVVNRLIDEFIESGTCDAVQELTKPFSLEMKWHWLVNVLGVAPDNRENVEEWVEIWLHRHFEPEFEDAKLGLISWVESAIARRRSEPRRDDLLDVLLHGEVDGRRLTEDEARGMMIVLIHGGIFATGGTIANILFRLAVYPDLQDTLRSRPQLLPSAIEELMRIEPPVTGIARYCTRDTEIGGQKIRAGERVFYLIPAANRDPDEFENPLQIDFERRKNPDLAFGAGRHRCPGATIATVNVRVALEELLKRLNDFRVAPGGTPRRSTGNEWRLDSLPLSFSPGARLDG